MRSPVSLLLAVICATVVVAAWLEAGDDRLSPAEGVLLGVVEGVTEFLPVSSTGHLAVTNELLGLTASPDAEEAADAYAIAIQAGAIVAVLALYRERVGNALSSIAGRGRDPVGGRRLLVALAAGFVPAAGLGLALGDVIKEQLFGTWPVVVAWLVGGVVILGWRRFGGDRELEQLGLGHGLAIGLAQVLALWPGTSRSLVTILAALALGYTMSAAVEFAFLLGLVTLGAATAYEALASGATIVERFGVLAPVLGFAAAFVSALLAVRWMVQYLRTRSLAVFGWYRIGIAVAVGALALWA